MGDDATVKISTLLGTDDQKSQAKKFSYVAPKELKQGRSLVPLVRSDILFSMVQIFKTGGGEQQLHTHTAMDGFWFVLAGRARFYGKDDVLLAELGPHEGIFIPREVSYWFEAGDCEQCELLQVEAIDRRLQNKVIYHDEVKPGSVEVFSPEGNLLAAAAQLGG